MTNKIKITQADFDDMYQIEGKEITEEIPDVPSAKQETTTPEFLTDEEEEHDKILFADLPDIEVEE